MKADITGVERISSTRHEFMIRVFVDQPSPEFDHLFGVFRNHKGVYNR